MTTPPPPRPPDDDRDPRVGAWLAVEPLDEVTRARLVRRAVAEADRPAEPRPCRRPLVAVLAVAAALVVAVVVGIAALVSRDGESSFTAVDAPTSREMTRGAPGAEQFSGDEAPTSGSPAMVPEPTLDALDEQDEQVVALRGLGDLGDVSTPRRLARAIARRVAAGEPATPLTGCALATSRELGAPVAAGTGRIADRAAVVVVVERADGTRAAIATTPACGRVVSADLG